MILLRYSKSVTQSVDKRIHLIWRGIEIFRIYAFAIMFHLVKNILECAVKWYLKFDFKVIYFVSDLIINIFSFSIKWGNFILKKTPNNFIALRWRPRTPLATSPWRTPRRSPSPLSGCPDIADARTASRPIRSGKWFDHSSWGSLLIFHGGLIFSFKS
jgi:hypothetical protein